MFRCNHDHQGACYLSFAKVTLASSNSTLPDGGDYTETCRNIFNVNFNISFKAVLLCISW